MSYCEDDTIVTRIFYDIHYSIRFFLDNLDKCMQFNHSGNVTFSRAQYAFSHCNRVGLDRTAYSPNLLHYTFLRS